MPISILDSAFYCQGYFLQRIEWCSIKSSISRHIIKPVLGDLNVLVEISPLILVLLDATPIIRNIMTTGNRCLIFARCINWQWMEHYLSTKISQNNMEIAEWSHCHSNWSYLYISTIWSHSLLMRRADINTTHYLVRGYLSIKLKCPQKRKRHVKRKEHLHSIIYAINLGAKNTATKSLKDFPRIRKFLALKISGLNWGIQQMKSLLRFLVKRIGKRKTIISPRKLRTYLGNGAKLRRNLAQQKSLWLF